MKKSAIHLLLALSIAGTYTLAISPRTGRVISNSNLSDLPDATAEAEELGETASANASE